MIQDNLHDTATAELRRVCAALVAEYRKPLPDGDAGLVEAERRCEALVPEIAALYRAYAIGFVEERRYIAGNACTPCAVERELYDFIIGTAPAGPAGVAAKLRLLARESGGYTHDALAQCIEAVERFAAPATREPRP